jgi:pimeloyl-ACP methyl ester carboxylesterase
MVAVHFLPHFAVRSEQIKALQSQESRYRDISYQLDKTKTLLIWGQKDGIVPISVGENLHRTYPNTTELVVFKKSKHEAHFRYSKKINRVILEFLSK